MNSFYNDNLVLFSRRFPQLYETCKEIINGFTGINELTVREAKTGKPTAEENGLLLHSAYDPIREAQKLFDKSSWQNVEAAVFFSFGLGYGPLEFARQFPQKTLILVEPDILYLFAAFNYIDWSPVFSHKNLILLAGAEQQTVIQLLEKTGFDNCRIQHNKTQSAHAQAYFSDLTRLMQRNKQKNAINEVTLEKFGHLWLRNTLRNKKYAALLDGVARYKNKACDLPVCLIAAGPSLDDILPHLAEIKKRCILICVDTALKACLKTGCQPHFIVLGDPQYWNLRHLDGLSAPESILITELATYPPVFRFQCRELILFSSLYPPGQFIEQYTGDCGTLGAGGSVAATAWDFARFLGCKTIYTAALDLSFPENKTHFKGATFEERAHIFSSRLNTAENDSCRALYDAFPFYAQNYEEKPVLTDKRLSLFAWWFESKCAEFPSQKTFALGGKGLRIPGIETKQITSLLELPDREQEINATCFNTDKPDKITRELKQIALKKAVEQAKDDLTTILAAGEKARLFCEEAKQLEKAPLTTQNSSRLQYILQKLSEIDSSILKNKASGLTSLIFPTDSQLEKILTRQKISSPLEKSLCVYSNLILSAQTYLKYL